VIVTPNCGRVAEYGKTGFITPPRDVQALADAIMEFDHNRNLVKEMSPLCIKASEAFSIDAYGRRLVEIIGNSNLHWNTK
jgi:glycosyltransferase involved in cell wall biosynthesis